MLEMGFYCGLAILYPYDPVYCPTDSCGGDCRGVYIYTAKSAPLPPTETKCRHYVDGKRFEWSPRTVDLSSSEGYRKQQVCYVADKGDPK
jgi:hypothetical protein